MQVPETKNKAETLEADDLQPTRIHQLMTGYLTSKAIFSGLELGLFDALEEQDQTVTTLAERLGLALRPMRILLTALGGEHIITHDGAYYRNSKWARSFLVTSSPKFLGGFAT